MALDGGDGAVLLESAVKDQEMGRYSLIAIEPFAEFKSKGARSEFVSGEQREMKESAPYEHLKEVIASTRLCSNLHLPPLVGGAIGFATLRRGPPFREIPDRHPDTDELPDLLFLFHAVHIAFDHAKGTVLFRSIWI